MIARVGILRLGGLKLRVENEKSFWRSLSFLDLNFCNSQFFNFQFSIFNSYEA